MSKKSVVLLSGGLDSTTCCAIAASKGADIYALTIDYNQRNVWEINAAKEVAKTYGAVEHVVLPINLREFGGSALTDSSVELARDVPLDEIGKTIPTSYVPARNTIFLALALSFAETRGATEIWTGVNALDYSGYPDCRPEYIDAFSKMAHLATKSGVSGSDISIETPLLFLTKADIIKRGVSLGVDYSLTRTCYDLDEHGRACGRCESCLLRKQGFEEAGVPDPTVYRD